MGIDWGFISKATGNAKEAILTPFQAKKLSKACYNLLRYTRKFMTAYLKAIMSGQ